MPSMPTRITGRAVLERPETGRAEQIACITSGGEVVARGELSDDGAFLVQADLVPGAYGLFVVAPGHDVSRREFVVETGAPDDVDIGDVVLLGSEFAPGIHGQLWDSDSDVPISPGRVSLYRRDACVATTSVSGDGRFSFEWSGVRPIRPGRYALVTDTPRHRDRSMPVVVDGDVASEQLGLVELTPLGDRSAG